MATNKGRVYFGLMGYHFNPDDITRMIDLEPTSVNAKGAGTNLDKPAISSWELSTETLEGDEIDLYALADILLKELEPQKEKILQVIKSHNLSPRVSIELTLSVNKGESSPEVGIGSRMMRFLAEIGAFFNVEYELSERI